MAILLLSVAISTFTPQATPTTTDTVQVAQDTKAPAIAASTTTTAALAPTEPPVPTEEPKPQFMAEKLRAAILNDESTVIPFTYVTGDPGWNILMMQYDSLYTLDLDGETQPWLVTDLEESEDGLSYTLKLRDDVTWNDGKPFTAEDVKFSWDFLTSYPVGRFASDITGFESADVIDDFTVVIKLKEVKPTYIRNAFTDVPIIP